MQQKLFLVLEGVSFLLFEIYSLYRLHKNYTKLSKNTKFSGQIVIMSFTEVFIERNHSLIMEMILLYLNDEDVKNLLSVAEIENQVIGRCGRLKAICWSKMNNESISMGALKFDHLALFKNSFKREVRCERGYNYSVMREVLKEAAGMGKMKMLEYLLDPSAMDHRLILQNPGCFNEAVQEAVKKDQIEAVKFIFKAIGREKVYQLRYGIRLLKLVSYFHKI